MKRGDIPVSSKKLLVQTAASPLRNSPAWPAAEGWLSPCCLPQQQLRCTHSSHSTPSFTSLQSPGEKQQETEGTATSPAPPRRFLAYSLPQPYWGMHISLAEFTTSTEIDPRLQIHTVITSVQLAGIWRKSSEEIDKKETNPQLAPCNIFTRGRAYGHVEYPSHRAKRQRGSSEQHAQLKAGLPREALTREDWDKHLQKQPWVKGRHRHLLGVKLLLLFIGGKSSQPWHCASNTPSEEKERPDFFILNIKNQVPQSGLQDHCWSSSLWDHCTNSIREPSLQLPQAGSSGWCLHSPYQGKTKGRRTFSTCYFTQCQWSMPWRYPTSPSPPKVALDFIFSDNTHPVISSLIHKIKGWLKHHREMGNAKSEISVLCLPPPGRCPRAQAGAILAPT